MIHQAVLLHNFVHQALIKDLGLFYHKMVGLMGFLYTQEVRTLPLLKQFCHFHHHLLLYNCILDHKIVNKLHFQYDLSLYPIRQIISLVLLYYLLQFFYFQGVSNESMIYQEQTDWQSPCPLISHLGFVIFETQKEQFLLIPLQYFLNLQNLHYL